MSGKCFAQRVFKRSYFAIAFSAMFALHSPLLLADEHVQNSDGSNAANPNSESQNSDSRDSNTKVKGFTMPENGLNFPAWPAKSVVVKDVPPPPPLGPYMSTALNNAQAGKPHFKSMMSIPVPDFDDTPMTTFSPDLPWPEDNASVKRWVPDNGYTFVAPNMRPPQPSFNQGTNRGNVYQGNAQQGRFQPNSQPNRMSPQRQQGNYSRPPVPTYNTGSMYNKTMNNRAMYNVPVMRAPNAHSSTPHYPGSNYRGSNSGANYYAPRNQFRGNPSMQQRNLPVNQNNARNNHVGRYSNGMGQHPQANTGYNRPEYGSRPPQMMPPSSSHQR